MRLLSRREWMFLAFIFVYSFVPTFAGMLRVVELLGGLAIVPENPRAIAYPLPIVLHILSSFLFCLLGGLQFVPSIRRRHLRVHRAMGKTLAAAGCLSALTGLWMTLAFAFPQELQGALLYWVRIALSVSMTGLIVWAVIAVRLGNVPSHGAAMLRAYAIGQGASTQAFLGLGWMVASGTELMGPWRDVLIGVRMVHQLALLRVFDLQDVCLKVSRRSAAPSSPHHFITISTHLTEPDAAPDRGWTAIGEQDALSNNSA